MAEALTIASLPKQALEATAVFSAEHLDGVRERLAAGEHLTVVLPPASYDHADWRRATVRDLARAYTPVRVNFIAGSDGARIAATIEYLDQAHGVTGQYLELTDDE